MNLGLIAVVATFLILVATAAVIIAVFPRRRPPHGPEADYDDRPTHS